MNTFAKNVNLLDYSEMSEDASFVLNSVIEQCRQKDYPSLKPDEHFEYFAAQQALKSRRFNPDVAELDSGIVGGNGDGGVDGFYLFVNRRLIREDTDTLIFKGQQLDIELVIVQAKNKASFEESVPQKFKDFTENCVRLNADLTSATSKVLYNETLRDMVQKFHDVYKPALVMHPNLAVRFFHISVGEQVDRKVEIRAEQLKTYFLELFPTADFGYEYIRGKRLLELFQQQPERTLSLPTPKYFDWKTFGRNAFVCVVKLPDFYQFITEQEQLREYLFDANVRDHAPDAKVNKGIQISLAVPSNEDFWWLNNGITLLATQVFYNDGSLQLTDPLIVNGLQTSYEIYKHFSSRASREDQRTLMIKVIANTVPETSDHIINATNSQTKILAINLHATEQIHRNIEATLKTGDLFYDRRKNFYKNKGTPASKIITIGYMAQALAAIALQQPDNARARPTTVAEKNYEALFSEKHPLASYLRCIQILKRVESFLDAKNLDRGTRLNLIFYLAMYVACAALKSARPTRNRIAKLDTSSLTDDMLNDCYKWLYGKYTALGGDDRAAKGPELIAKLKIRIREQYGRKKK